MRTSRLEAFSDGVLAIIITVMVLELPRPDGPTLHDLGGSANGFLSYLLSFVYVGIYWTNHHHLFQIVPRVGGAVLWANLHLLFWLSVVPFTTSWMEQTHFARGPVVVYGVDLLLAAVAYFVLQLTLLDADDSGRLRAALGSDVKGKISPVLYVVGIAGAFVTVWVAITMFVVVALIWVVPDRRMERAVAACDTEDATQR